ncbi:hypothetical protein [Microbacterium sp.]|uniref:hypothetical protein n=1 Tax=Microbacterium sp. TaxID=51671 RepID=UPI0028127969|nr:hypothetical protein [Microbacterium sp.]
MRILTAMLLCFAVIVLSPVSAAAGTPPTCSSNARIGCPTVTTDAGNLYASGTKHQNGSPGSRTDGAQRQRGGNHSTNPVYNPIAWTPPTFEECRDAWNYIRCYRWNPDGETPRAEGDTTPAIPEITITDLARFSPPGTAVAGEPNNLGVAGLPTNFVATASAVTQQGELFGYPISVRFTPASFTFHYGDGASTTTGDGGSTWADLGQAQFTPTDTSHTYAERGEYTARVDVAYSAEIDLGVGWFPISGRLTATGPGQLIRVFEAHTALVAHTCTERPSSPGC